MSCAALIVAGPPPTGGGGGPLGPGLPGVIGAVDPAACTTADGLENIGALAPSLLVAVSATRSVLPT
ncbi:MAG TPA: hypothetical protein VIH71_18350, partial [Solirubrobacteraceae bacterium]